MQNRSREKQEILSFIGAGRLGSTLASQFFSHHFSISSIIDIDSSKACQCKIKCGARVGSQDIREIEPETTILFISVPDEEIERIAISLKKQDIPKPGMVVAHTSGLLSSNALASIRQPDISICSFHPCYSFPENHEGKLNDVYFALEGDQEGCRCLEKLVHSIGGNPFYLSKEDKTLYHAACTMASNHLVALMQLVQNVLGETSQTDHLYRILPLVRETVKNIEQIGVEKSLTGPILRGDSLTVEKHLEALKKSDGDLTSPYITLGRTILKMAKKLGLNQEKAQPLETIFGHYGGR